jgi:RNA polymerase sigma-70 factor (ECF subfamily)
MDEDLQLIRRARKGQREAFDTLFERYGARLHGFAFRISNNTATADDLVQEAFLAAFRGLSGYKGGSSFFNWMCGIVVRKHRDSRRRRPEAELSEEIAVICTESLDLDRAIDALKADQREVFVLIKVVGLTNNEAADALQKPVGTVKWLCAEAIRTLQISLKEGQINELVG